MCTYSMLLIWIIFPNNTNMVRLYDNLIVSIYRMVRIWLTVVNTYQPPLTTTRLSLQYTFKFDIHKDKVYATFLDSTFFPPLFYSILFYSINAIPLGTCEKAKACKPGPHPVGSPVYSILCTAY